MIRVILLAMLLTGCASSNFKCDNKTPYLSVGASYKVNEFEITWFNKETGEVNQVGQSPLGGRVELGVKCENWKAGYHHASDILTNYPFDKTNREYYKDEIFVDYVIEFDSF